MLPACSSGTITALPIRCTIQASPTTPCICLVISICYFMRLDETGRLERSSCSHGAAHAYNTFYCACYVALLKVAITSVRAKVSDLYTVGEHTLKCVNKRLRVRGTNGCVFEASRFGPRRLEFEDNSCSRR